MLEDVVTMLFIYFFEIVESNSIKFLLRVSLNAIEKVQLIVSNFCFYDSYNSRLMKYPPNILHIFFVHILQLYIFVNFIENKTFE